MVQTYPACSGDCCGGCDPRSGTPQEPRQASRHTTTARGMIDPKCQHCRKARHHHKSGSLHCPQGQKRGGVFVNFDRTKTFALKSPKPRQRIAPRSVVKQDYHAEYMRAKAARIRQHPQCECCVAFNLSRINPAQDGHHPFGQAGKLIMVFVVVCRECHDRFHGSPGEARSGGWICDTTKVSYRISGPVRAAIVRSGFLELLREARGR